MFKKKGSLKDAGHRGSSNSQARHSHCAIRVDVRYAQLNPHTRQWPRALSPAAVQTVQYDWEQRDFTQAIQLGVCQLTAGSAQS